MGARAGGPHKAPLTVKKGTESIGISPLGVGGIPHLETSEPLVFLPLPFMHNHLMFIKFAGEATSNSRRLLIVSDSAYSDFDTFCQPLHSCLRSSACRRPMLGHHHESPTDIAAKALVRQTACGYRSYPDGRQFLGCQRD
jgi:hypothetical protein